MTVSSDINGTLSSVSWSDEQLYLREFVHRHALPAVVRITKGQYCNLGVSSISNPGLQSTILVTNLGRRKRILAQSIKFKDSKRVVPVGPKLAIPNSYDGFFELLSEDGRSVRCIESVSELNRRFPDAVLVRDNFRAFVSKSDDLETIEDSSRLVQSGETLLLVGEVAKKSRTHDKQQTKFLRCFDKNGENVFLPLELKGCKFSAIAKEDNISGVHTVENLTSKRLPVMTRLVHGLPPVGLKSSQSFLPEIRLFSVIEEDYLVAMTLNSNATSIVPLPLPANLKFNYATNMNLISTTKEFMRLKERCIELSSHLDDRIVVHDISAPKDLRINGADLKQKQALNKPLITVNANRNRFYPASSNSDEYDEIEQIYDYVRGFAPLPKTARGWKYEPVNSSPLNNKQANSTDENSAASSSQNTSSSDMTPPEPPPIETLPSRRNNQQEMSVLFSPPPWGLYGHINEVNQPQQVVRPPPEAKKRQRHSAERNQENLVPLNNTATPRFIKSANYRSMQGSTGTTYRQRLFRSNRSSGHNKEGAAFNGHAMFQMRYKSMTNLASASSSQQVNGNEYDTLNSSNSGGKTSGGSSSTRQPEKRSRKLSRPKSLTNLAFWGSNSKERSASRQSLNVPDFDPLRRLEPGVFGGPGNRRLDFSPAHHANPAAFANGKKLGSSSSKAKIGTLYL